MYKYAAIKNNIVEFIAQSEHDIDELVIEKFLENKYKIINVTKNNQVVNGSELIDNIFISPRPFPSWSINKNKKIWEAPQKMPQDNNFYVWNEDILNWEKIECEV